MTMKASALLFIAITMIGNLLGFGPYSALAAMYFPAFIFGLEGVNLRARKLMRKGYRDAAVVIAEDLETAERRFFGSFGSGTRCGSLLWVNQDSVLGHAA